VVAAPTCHNTATNNRCEIVLTSTPVCMHTLLLAYVAHDAGHQPEPTNTREALPPGGGGGSGGEDSVAYWRAAVAADALEDSGPGAGDCLGAL
jgi:hypothetical protein